MTWDVVHSFRKLQGILLTLGLFLGTLSGCHSKQSQPSEVPGANEPRTTEASRSALGPSHDLSDDEAAGGHTLKKHVGRTDEQLQQRLSRERNISAASTYTDRQTAEAVVGAVLQEQQPKIQRWLERQGGHPNLVLDYDGDSAHPIGRTMRRGENQSEPCSQAVVVLKFVDSDRYYVLTTYPECR
jgi:hypothetical protein